MKNLEIRVFNEAPKLLEQRANEKGEKRLQGYAAVFNSDSVDLGYFTESIRPGAFRSSIEKRLDVRGLVDHVPSQILARTSEANTLHLKEDEHGLWMEMYPLPDTQLARDVTENIRLKNITQMSFGFYTLEDKWSKRNGKEHRELIDLELYDVSIVTYPAYPASSVEARGAVKELEIRSAESVWNEHVKKEGRSIAGYWNIKQRIMSLDL